MPVGRITGETPQELRERISNFPESESHSTTAKDFQLLSDDETKTIQALAETVAEKDGRVFVPKFGCKNAGYSMGQPTSLVLQEIRRLDRSSSDFDNQLDCTLRGGDYYQSTQELNADDLMWLVDYLDDVSCHITSSHPALSRA